MLEQIQEIDGQLSHAIEAYNLANVKLDEINADLKANARHLTIAKSSLRNAQTHLSARLVSLYVNGGEGNALEVLLGAESLDDLLNRMDAVERVSDQDARVLREVKHFRNEVKQRKVRLDRAANRAGPGRRRRRPTSAGRSRASSPSGSGCSRRSRARSPASRPPSGSGSSGSWRRRGRASPPRTVQRQGDVEDSRPRPSTRLSVEAALAPAPGRPLRRRRRDRDAVPRRAVRVGRCQPVGLRLLRADHVRVRPDGRLAAAPRGVAVRHGQSVSADQLQAGDLVFFNGLGHAGIYIGGGQFIHAPHSGDVVKISSLSDSWYAATWVGARRI